jgi:hypothetical protein
MKRLFVGGVAALACLAVFGSTTLAQRDAQEEKAREVQAKEDFVSSKVAIRLIPLPERVAMADLVTLGKLGKVEPKNVKATPIYGGDQKVEYQVLSLELKDPVLGVKKGAKTIRVGFVPPQQGGGGGGGRPIIRPGRPQPLVLETGMEGCFFLTKHPVEDFYVTTDMFSFLNKKDNANFDKDVKVIKRYGKMLADPMKGLKAKDATERAETATLLIMRYRSFKFGGAKTEAISADESKLILKGLADGDFAKQIRDQNEIAPIMAFYRLGLTEKDGWKPGPIQNQNDLHAAIKAWLKDNAGKYRIQRFVAETPKKEKK